MEITDDKLIASFLLGELLEDKRVGIEERMFKDDGFYEQVLAIQEELADDYVQNKLSTNQRLQFERHPKAERKPCAWPADINYFFEITMRVPNCRPTPFEKLPNSSLARLFWKSRGLK